MAEAAAAADAPMVIAAAEIDISVIQLERIATLPADALVARYSDQILAL